MADLDDVGVHAMNRQMQDRIVTKAHLIDGPTMPECLRTLCAHVSAYKAIVARGEGQDFAEHKPAIRFPLRRGTEIRAE